MKKQIVTACALIASVAAFAASVTSDNTFGVLKIDVSETATEVVIPVPWAAIGSGDGAVKVVDFIMPNGRKNGDKLYWYDASAKYYKVWEANGSGSWTPLTTVKVTKWNEVGTVAASDSNTIARGQAAILVLKAAGSGNGAVYLNGQYSTAAATTTVYGLTEDEVPFKDRGMSRATLIAAPKAADCNLNSDLSYYTSEDVNTQFSSESMIGDTIQVFNGDNYTYGYVQDGYKWYKIDSTSGNRTAEGCTIPMGTGAWYRRSNAGNFVIKWN